MTVEAVCRGVLNKMTEFLAQQPLAMDKLNAE
jgi:hypothetical protein